MTDLFHVDQSTADRWRADGRFVLFGEGCRHAGPGAFVGKGDLLTNDPPAAMTEAAKPAFYDHDPDQPLGQRRHPVTVPCDHQGGVVISTVYGHPDWSKNKTTCLKCNWQYGRISTGLLAIVEFGPLEFVGVEKRWRPGEYLWVPGDGTIQHAVLGRTPMFDNWTDRFPPDVDLREAGSVSRGANDASTSFDPASLVGQWAIGGRIEVAG